MTRDLSMEITLFVEFSLKVYTYILIVKDKYYDDYNFYVIIKYKTQINEHKYTSFS